jgi:hypothetical protein
VSRFKQAFRRIDMLRCDPLQIGSIHADALLKALSPISVFLSGRS